MKGFFLVFKREMDRRPEVRCRERHRAPLAANMRQTDFDGELSEQTEHAGPLRIHVTTLFKDHDEDIGRQSSDRRFGVLNARRASLEIAHEADEFVMRSLEPADLGVELFQLVLEPCVTLGGFVVEIAEGHGRVCCCSALVSVPSEARRILWIRTMGNG